MYEYLSFWIVLKAPIISDLWQLKKWSIHFSIRGPFVSCVIRIGICIGCNDCTCIKGIILRKSFSAIACTILFKGW